MSEPADPHSVDTGSAALWQDRVLCAAEALDALGETPTMTRLKEMVAAKYASRFDAEARLYAGRRPLWEVSVDRAVPVLVRRRLLSSGTRNSSGSDEGVSRPKGVSEREFRLTRRGRDQVAGACARAEAVGTHSSPVGDTRDDMLVAGVLTPPLREALKPAPPPALLGVLPVSAPQAEGGDVPQPIMIELNLTFGTGLGEAIHRVRRLWRMIGAAGDPLVVADQ